ncbi:hypothetical protein MUK42_11060 [Musa troglodytarum]|uniref:Uncharacterized protein n=1 Tax=Musa troglodytarum TaxID=320322 RepID=A0A9E7KEB5_9LILI|nr:hypothetical protein MUK42_11060 [Musa troglodytarum]URE14347.1 hypothetical protein MUK42_11060 [Musa troglodytarum]
MMRQASSRNQRNKGLRLTNVLQICLLAAVCFWLLYQLKHSYDKKKALDEQHPRILNNVEDGQPDFIDLGRKDLPRDKMMISGDKIHNKEEENDEIEEDEDGDAQRVMGDEEAKGVGDDGIDEEDNEQGDEQDDQERGDEETEDGEDSMNEENKDDQVDEAEFLDGQEHEVGSSQEAHEESYKRDDASSAVHRENQVTGTEDKNDSVEEEQLKNDEKEVETRLATSREDDGLNDHNNMSVALVVAISNDTIQNNSLTINSAAAERLEQELSPADNQTRLQANSTIESASYHQVKLQTDSPIDVTDDAAEGNTNTVLLENGALIRSSNDYQNITTGLGSPEEDNSILKSVVEEQPRKSNTNIGQDNLEELSTVSLAVNENGDAVEGDSAGSSHRMVIDEERDARIDLSTLPDIQIDVKNIEDEAAE